MTTATAEATTILEGYVEVECVLFLESYIAHPFWPEQSQRIDIEKKSGMNRCKSDSTRDKALKAYLETLDLTLEDFHILKAKASRQWYRRDPDDPTSEIVIPRHHLSSCIVQTLNSAPSAIRGSYKSESVRHNIRMSDFRTGKVKCDEPLFDRYVKLEGSNQRSRQINEVIRNFKAQGTLHVEMNLQKSENHLKLLENLFGFALKEVGIGASRKMGYGHGKVVGLKLV